jgi:hypothetical protein
VGLLTKYKSKNSWFYNKQCSVNQQTPCHQSLARRQWHHQLAESAGLAKSY